MWDIWLYIGIFFLGAVVALVDHAARAVKCKLNKKLFKFLPVRHIPTVIAFVLALSAFIHYGLNPDEKAYSLSILSVALVFIAISVAFDLGIIFWNKKK